MSRVVDKEWERVNFLMFSRREENIPAKRVKGKFRLKTDRPEWFRFKRVFSTVNNRNPRVWQIHVYRTKFLTQFKRGPVK